MTQSLCLIISLVGNSINLFYYVYSDKSKDYKDTQNDHKERQINLQMQNDYRETQNDTNTNFHEKFVFFAQHIPTMFDVTRADVTDTLLMNDDNNFKLKLVLEVLNMNSFSSYQTTKNQQKKHC